MLNLRSSPLPLFLALAAACSDSRPTNPPGPGPSGNKDAGTSAASSCGNGVINGVEPCDGTAFAAGVSCAGLGLRSGQLACNSNCTVDTANCGVRDYCTANGKYGNGECDPCELLGGMRDPDCETVCAMDGVCADRFDNLTGTWTCRRRGLTDPDCGQCGNSVLDGNELCDGRAFANNKITCGDYGFLGGELACKGDCSPNFAGCTFSVCGDGNKEGPEACDGTTFDGTDCVSRGFAGGMLTCTSSCTVSESSCIRPGCGNNILEPGLGEECEMGMLGGATCESRGFAGGTLGCDGTCHFNEAACVSPGCGNNIREMNEECEGMDLNGGTCMGQGFLGGTLACSGTSCTYDTSACVSPGCGNGIIEPGTPEQCEGNDLGGGTCAMQAGFAGGTLRCGMDCRYDTSQCVASGCGNNIIESGEQCEGTNLNGGTCMGQGFVAGQLSCDAACRYDTTQCVRGGCGNNIAEANEQCDGTDLRGSSCQQQGWTSGTLRCAMGCTYDTTSCTGRGAVCGDGVVQGLEACDGNAFGIPNRDCSQVGLGTGLITCNACALNFSGCSNRDFCAANMYYGDGACDICQLGGGMRDTMDCGASSGMRGRCGADGNCAEYYDGISGGYTCFQLYGQRDPDCDCGDGLLTQPQANGLMTEICEGTNFNISTACTDYGFTTGTLRCNSNCFPDFTNCR